MADTKHSKPVRRRSDAEIELSAEYDRLRAAATRLDRLAPGGGDKLRRAAAEALTKAVVDTLTT